MEERPWPEWRGGKPITPPQLARALAPFGVRPVNIRVGKHVPKGYTEAAFADAWARYLPAAASATDIPSGQDGGCGAATPLQHCSNTGKQANAAATATPVVAAANAGNHKQKQPCSGVAAETGVSGTEGGAPDPDADKAGWFI